MLRVIAAVNQSHVSIGSSRRKRAQPVLISLDTTLSGNLTVCSTCTNDSMMMATG